MTLMFYYMPYSTAGTTHDVLAALGVEHEVKELSIANGDTESPAFLAVNPNGRVPVIVHNGTPIWESAAITIYLGEVFGTKAGLYPEPGPQRGQAMSWLVWSSTTLSLAAGTYFGHLPSAPETKSKESIPVGERSPFEAARSLKKLHKALHVLDDALAKHPFIIGKSFSLVDVHVKSFIEWVRMLSVDFTQYGNIATWLQACEKAVTQKK
ncbi:glutathione S-transferase [Rhizoclosmatium globosum]|uniref:Glutathione S-transferase n=1 Tax=Rhizoclosmatium globosum TaxID=329046 RepID=A0A1Y2AED9_9FUNG|nr:glutathione S-transferase [Rhizoclosmatium globosum]|eukprot:ORY20305.1 glutathione S-transferase [Rhizoclosmatium globosum]